MRDARGAIDRKALGQRVFGRPEELRPPRAHPAPDGAGGRAPDGLARARARGATLAVLDIPLLFETDRIDRVGGVIVVSAPLRLQRERVLRRPGMNRERLTAILDSQLPDHRKRGRADFRRHHGIEPCGGSAAARRDRPARPAGRMAAQPAAAASQGENGMREIVIDTETTGLDPHAGHRVVEIAAIELFHHVPTGRKFHRYVNPERDMPAEAYAVHGLSAEFLAGPSAALLRP